MRLSRLRPWRGCGSTVEKIGVAARATGFTVRHLGGTVAALFYQPLAAIRQRVGWLGRLRLGPLGFEPRTKGL